MSTLNQLKNGETAVVTSISGGRRFITRASAIGFTPDTPVTMILNSRLVPILVFVRNSQIAIGRREAAKIFIKRG